MTSVTDLDAVRVRFLAQRPQLDVLRDLVEARLREQLAARHLVAGEVETRVKDVASFIKKALRKGYSDPWDDIRDKVGVRLVAMYADVVPELERMVNESFAVHHYEDKRTSLEPNKLDYMGSHFEASIRDADATADVAGLVFEVQVHTQAESLWAGISHELLYKAPDAPPNNISRALYRLLALVEFFDLEVARARRAIMDQPGFPEALVLSELERHFFSLTAHRADPALSRFVIGVLRPLLSDDELTRYPEHLERFVSEHRDKLRGIYEDYINDDRNPLMSQPESLLVFERLENDLQRVPDVWVAQLPPGLLRSFSEIWGTPVDVGP
ncbi:MAG: hypothetical protein M3256_06330 [Actinomycetota bacterium]|nr:hypothetical protein [Actinomycetota bacterium]